MGEYKAILTERDCNVGILTLNRPEKLNAMGPGASAAASI